MATDLETTTEGGEHAQARPSLKITGLHIRGLKSIKSLDLPEDGLGWDGEIPDFVMVGGINGSGKTTLLEFLAGVFEQPEGYTSKNENPVQISPSLLAAEASIDLMFSPGGVERGAIRFLIGNQNFIDNNKNENWFGFVRQDIPFSSWGARCGSLSPELPIIARLAKWTTLSREVSGHPGVVYFPSERRTLIKPTTNYKFAGKLSDRPRFVDRWEPSKDESVDSLVERLYAIRWEDLNAKEEGRDQEANGFEAYSQAFNRFFEGRKRLRWHMAELVVETKSGDIHDLSELSSGEKQVILFMGELLHRWRPGSLILIDEPELHLHESYQTKLWESLVDWQKERGGQVIIATQSGHLFRISDPGIKVLLSARRAR